MTLEPSPSPSKDVRAVLLARVRLILDSPTVGVDIRNKQGIYEVVRRLADEGVAILLISDEAPEVYFNSDRILHMRDGRIASEFIPGADSQQALSVALYA